MKKYIVTILLLSFLVSACGNRNAKNTSDNEVTANSDEWIGSYSFYEFLPPNINMGYGLTVYKENEEYYANVTIDGFQTMTRLRAKIQTDSNKANFIFDEYLPENMFELYKKGDVLLTLERKGIDILTTWGKISPVDENNEPNGKIYFTKMSANADEWLGYYSFRDVLDRRYTDYFLTIYKENEEYFATLKTYGYQTQTNIKAKLIVEDELADLLFEKYLPENEFDKHFKVGEIVLTLDRKNGKLHTDGGKVMQIGNTEPENIYFTLSSEQLDIISFKPMNGPAVLLGNSIMLLNNNLEEVEDISNLNTKIVEITAISGSLINETDDICDAYWYVKIKVGDKEGIVNGKNVFQIECPFEDYSSKDKKMLIDGKRLEFLTTTCLTVGTVYDGSLVDCPVYQPLIILDEKNDFYGLIDLIPNDTDDGREQFNYFQLESNSGIYEKIVSVDVDGSTIKLNIHVTFQEGKTDYEVLLKYDQNKYTATRSNFGEIVYD